MKLSKRPTLLLLTVVAVLGVLLGAMLLALRGAASRSRLEQMASSALDMQVRIGGAVHVQLLAGHRSIQTTQQYIDGDTDAQR